MASPDRRAAAALGAPASPPPSAPQGLDAVAAADPREATAPGFDPYAAFDALEPASPTRPGLDDARTPGPRVEEPEHTAPSVGRAPLAPEVPTEALEESTWPALPDRTIPRGAADLDPEITAELGEPAPDGDQGFLDLDDA